MTKIDHNGPNSDYSELKILCPYWIKIPLAGTYHRNISKIYFCPTINLLLRFHQNKGLSPNKKWIFRPQIDFLSGFQKCGYLLTQSSILFCFGVVFPDSNRFTYFLRGVFDSVSTPFRLRVIKSSNAFLTEPSLMQFRSFSPSMFLQISTLSAELDSKVLIRFDTIFGEFTCLDTRWCCCVNIVDLRLLECGDFGLFELLNLISDLNTFLRFTSFGVDLKVFSVIKFDGGDICLSTRSISITFMLLS